MSMNRPRLRRMDKRSGRASAWPRLECLERRDLLAVIPVTTTSDSGAGSLRQAILDSNASSGVTDTITFAIAGTGAQTINLLSSLPTITDSAIIDGTTQPGAVAGTPLIELNGTGAEAGANGLTITAGLTTVRGLVINRFSGNGIVLQTLGNNTIAGNYIGVDPTGTALSSNSADGVLIDGSANNTIGGTTTGNRNVISGNNGFGVDIKNSAATGNVVEGNLIGTNAAGAAALRNLGGGVQILNAPTNTIGGTLSGARNVISGNNLTGVLISDSLSTGNRVQGNFIGTTSTGATALPNTAGGTRIAAASNNTIGGTDTNAGNTISGNTGYGISIDTTGATGNTVQNNLIGTTNTGLAVLPNQGDGILLGNNNNTIGGTTLNAGNVISGNSGNGLRILGAATGNIVQNNFIGTDKGSTVDLGNSYGVFIESGSNNIIGAAASATGTVAGAGNSIAFNDNNGVTVISGTGNSIRQNRTFSNGKLAIDLGNNGPTLNDPQDPDVGPNLIQNSPSVSLATTASGVTTIQGQLFSLPSTTFQLDFYSNTVLDPVLGQGRVYLGSKSVTTDATGLVSYTFTPASAVALNNIVTATATDPVGNTSESSLQALNIAPTADVGLIVASSSDPVAVNGYMTYTISILNAGPSNATGVIVTDTLPANVNVVISNASQGSISQSGSLITATLGTLNVGAAATISLVVIPTQAGTLTNKATVTSDQSDPNQANNTVTTTNTAVASADLQVAQTSNPIPGVAGSALSLIYTVTNNGPIAASGVVLTAPVPTNAAFGSVSTTQGNYIQANGNITVLVGALAAGASATVTMVVTPPVASLIASGAFVSGDQPDPLPTNNITSTQVTVNAAGGPTVIDGPQVTSVVRSGIRNQPTVITATFNSALDQGRAQNILNYTINLAGPDGKFNTRDDREIFVAKAVYDDTNDTVAITPQRHINLRKVVQLTIIGTDPDGLTDTNGLLLDGNNDGQPGGNFVTTFVGTTPAAISSQATVSVARLRRKK